MLTAELLAGFVIVAIRLVADYEINEDGAAKGTVLHPTGQYGPVAILAGLIGSFFFLSLLAMGGGTRAKLAVIFGATIIIALGVKSMAEITKVSGTLGAFGKVVVPPAAGTLPDVFGGAGTPGPAPAAPPSAPLVAAAGEGISQAVLGTPSTNAYKADLAALEKLNLVKVVGDSVVFAGDAVASLGKKIGSLFGF